MKVSIIIPTYNEEKTIAEIIRKVKEADLSKLKLEREILVIDDGSTDKTREILAKIEGIKYFFQEKNQGKSAAIKTCINKAKGDIILIQDADLEYNPKEYSQLIKPIIKDKKDVVYGSRFLNKKIKIFGKEKIYLPHHYIGNKFLTWITRILFKQNITDMETGYKVFKSSIIKGISIKSKRFNFEPEITAKLSKKGYKIYEVPITFNPRTFKEGKKITIFDGFKAIICLIENYFLKDE